ncbi:MAG TPA: DUF2628 domain-containing protein [Hyphomicrobiaceae bacterium]|nr:DUF2628 domain-containing protein [Hyphomicrobiaceae bacterium]
MIVTILPFPNQKRMIIFTVHEPPAPPIDRLDRAETMVFLKDGFTWSAFLLGPIWLVANRFWVSAVGYIALAVFGYVLLESAGAAEPLFGLFILALNAVVGFEAHWLKSSKLESKGWNVLGSVTGRSLAECERRFFENWLPTQALRRRDTEPAAPAAPEAKPKHRFAFFRRLRQG